MNLRAAPKRRAVVVGATGLVGRFLVLQLLDDPAYGEVVVLARKAFPHKHPKLTVHSMALDSLPDHPERMTGDDLFCCLGTTRRKAGSRKAFEHVDLELVQIITGVAERRRFKQLLIVSALGANPRSPLFYQRVKGRVEDIVSNMHFNAVHIFRPSLLLGPRDEKRTGEKAAATALRLAWPFLWGKAARFRAVRAGDLAQRMIEVAKLGLEGLHVHFAHGPLPEVPEPEENYDIEKTIRLRNFKPASIPPPSH